MIRVLGGPKRLCDGLTRRDLLTVGSLGLMGLGCGPASAGGPRRRRRPPGFGRAKACILLFLYGSPSQLETFDPKPDAPSGIRGEFGVIPSSVPGLNVCDRLPMHGPGHGQGGRRPVGDPPLRAPRGRVRASRASPGSAGPEELNPRDPAHYPFIGSVVDYADRLASRAGRRRVGEPAPALGLQQPSGRRGPPRRPLCRVPRRGLRPDRDRVRRARGRSRPARSSRRQTWEDHELYRGITPESRFRLGEAAREVDLDRPARPSPDAPGAARVGPSRPRRRGHGDRPASVDGVLAARPRRSSAGPSTSTGRSPATRESYGMTLFGQAALTARRLVEAGGRFITVFWDEYGLAGSGWDTHWDHFARMKDELLPGLDRTLSGLLIDLDARGLLDETLVLCLSEHGRTPKLSTGAGRRPRPLVAVLLGRAGRRRDRPGPGGRQVRQDRGRARLPPGQPQGPAGHGLSPPGDRPAPDADRSTRPAGPRRRRRGRDPRAARLKGGAIPRKVWSMGR